MSIPEYRIIAQIFEGNKTIFRLQKTGEYDYIEKTASDISQDVNMISSLNRKDAYVIGYVSASEKLFFDFSLSTNRV